MTLDAEKMHSQNAQVIEEFRRRGGHVGGNFEGAPVLLLHTVGAKSGEPRVNPMMYQRVGDAYAVFASAAGDDANPAWFHNLVAHPDVTAEIGNVELDLHARVLDEGRAGNRSGNARSATTPASPTTRRRPTGRSRWSCSNSAASPNERSRSRVSSGPGRGGCGCRARQST